MRSVSRLHSAAQRVGALQRKRRGRRGGGAPAAAANTLPSSWSRQAGTASTHLLGILDDGLHGVAGHHGHALVQRLGGLGGCKGRGRAWRSTE